MSSLIRDLRLACRQLVKRPIYALSIVAVFAIGIGANSAMYTAFEAWVLRPLDFENPDELVAVHETQPLQGRERVNTAAQTIGDWREGQTALAEIAVYRRATVNLSDTEDPVRIDATRIEARLLPMLGRLPVRGRNFSAQEDLPGRPAAVALISDDLWRERYDGDPAIVGQEVRVDGLSHEIVGVMPPHFAFPEWSDLWLPLGLDVQVGDRSERNLEAVARLAPGTSIDAAGEAMKVLAADLARRYPETHRNWSADVLPLRERWAPPVIDIALGASLAATLLVLLVICANVGSLVLAQVAARRREMAVRSYLGASRARLAQQSAVEIGLLSLLAGVLGLVLAQIAVDTMIHSAPISPPYLFRMQFSPLAALYTMVVALSAGLLCGWMPLLRGPADFESLKSGRRAGDQRSTTRTRSLLVASELALTTALLIGALLMVKSYALQQASTSGFDPDGAISTELVLSGTGFESPDQRRNAAFDLLAAVVGDPGVELAGLATRTPADQFGGFLQVLASGGSGEPTDAVSTSLSAVTGGYLEALDILPTRGRSFTPLEDREGAAVALLSNSLAERLWPGEDALGRQLRPSRLGSDGEAEWLTIVGLVPDIEVGRDLVDFSGTTHGQLYVPWATQSSPSVDVVVRSARPVQEAASRLRETIYTSLPGIPVPEVLTLRESLERGNWVGPFFARQLGQYAGLGLLISLIGLYGLVSDSVRQRDRELATRAAFGARHIDLLALVLGQASRLVLVGVAAGFVLAIATVRLGSSLLIGVSAFDPTVYGTVLGLLLTVPLLAATFPALRAVRRPPIDALRGE